MRELTDVIHRFAFETQRRSDNETHEREKMELRLQNDLLRSEKRLPPGDQQDSSLKLLHELHEQMASLRQENEELRKRIEQIEKK